MKRIFTLLVLVLVKGLVMAQDNRPMPPKPLPNFKILTTDSVWFTNADLKKGKPVVMMYFMTDCSHCHHLINELKPKLSQISNVQVVMVTYSANYDLRAIRAFKKEFGLGAYPNIIVGSDGYSDNVRSYYNVETTPFLAMYDKAHGWINYFDYTVKAEDFVTAARQASK